MKFLADTGSYLSTINIKHLDSVEQSKIRETNVRARGYSNNSIQFAGEITLKFKYNSRHVTHRFLVVENHYSSLIGRDLLSKLNCNLSISENINSLKTQNDVIKKYENYFSDKFVSNVQQKVSLPMKKNVQPVFCKARPVPIRLKDKVLEELSRLERAGVVTRVISSDWASPVVNVLKPNNKIRICADFSKTINKYMERANFPLPSMEEIMSKINNAKIIVIPESMACSHWLKIKGTKTSPSNCNGTLKKR